MGYEKQFISMWRNTVWTVIVDMCNRYIFSLVIFANFVKRAIQEILTRVETTNLECIQ